MTTPSEAVAPTTAPLPGELTPRRLHPVTPVFDLILFARGLVLPAIAFLAGGRRTMGVVLLVGLVLLVAVRTLEWARRTYVVADGVLRLDEGVLQRRHRVVPLERVQQVNVDRKLRHRLFGLAAVRVETAGGTGGSEVDLDVVSLAEARRVSSLVLAAKAAAGPVTTAGGGAPSTPDGAGAGAAAGAAASGAGAVGAVSLFGDALAAPDSRDLVRLSNGQLALAGITGAKLAVMLTLVGWLTQVLDDLPGSLLERLDLRPVLPTGTPALVLGLVAVLPVWFGLAAGASIVSDAGFALTRVGDDLRLRRGLFDRQEVAVPLGRIQLVRIEQSFLRRLLGLVSVRVQSAGEPNREAGRVAVPVLPVNRLEPLLHELLPGSAPLPPLIAAPAAARRRAVVRRVVPVLVGAVAVAAAARPWGAVALAAVPLAAGAGLLAHRGLGHARTAQHLIARRGSLLRTTVVVPVVKAQSVRVRSSLLQRRAGLATVVVDVAGRGVMPRVIDETQATAEELLEGVLARPDPSDVVADRVPG